MKVHAGIPAVLLWLAQVSAWASPPWPTDARLSGHAFLPPGLQVLQADSSASPLSLWLDRGEIAWAKVSQGASCQGCHGQPQALRTAATRFPRLDAQNRLINLEDQIIRCRQRAGHPQMASPEDPEVLSLSALLHQQAAGLPVALAVPAADAHTARAQWEAKLASGARHYATRLGRINLACVHCHDQHIGRQMRADVISPGHPTGFPVYRMSWQTLGSIDRRLRACYSGVQATVPAPGDPVLRELELYLKVRAQGMVLDGPSLRR